MQLLKYISIQDLKNILQEYKKKHYDNNYIEVVLKKRKLIDSLVYHTNYLPGSTKLSLRINNILYGTIKKYNSIELSEIRQHIYNLKPIYCAQCGRIIPFNKRINLFCNSSCSASYSNQRRIIKTGTNRRVKCSICGVEILRSIRANILTVKCDKCKQENYKNKKQVCVNCGTEFFYKYTVKTCSEKCKFEVFSKNRISFLMKNGTTNFNTKQQDFSYKIVNNIMVDSKLEMAAIIYLVDIFKADKIERYRNILFFRDENDKTRRFNPDFYVKKEGSIYIVEVKQKWNKDSNHIYYKYMKHKKQAIIDYCSRRNYNYIWLDSDYDCKFNKLYYSVLRGDI